MGRQRRAADASEVRRPSGVARDRLARRLHREVADVRVRLEEAVLRSDALLASGQPERAAEVLDEQQALLDELHRTLTSTVAAAAVEAEAERVILAAPDGPAVLGAPVVDATTPPRRSLRATASALASAAAVLTALIVVAPTTAPDTLAAGDARDPGATSTPADEHAPQGSATAGVTDGEPAAVDERAVGPNELEVRRLFTSPSPRADVSADDGLGARLAGLQALVDSFVATVVRAASELGTEPAVADGDDATAERVVPDLGSRPEPMVEDEADPARPVEEPRGPAADAGDDAPAAGPAGEPEDEDEDEERPLRLPEGDGNASTPGLPPLE